MDQPQGQRFTTAQPTHTYSPVHASQVVAIAMPPQFIHFGANSQVTECRHCRAHIKTTTKPKFTGKTHCVAILLCCFLCWPCVCLPYCCCCHDTVHYCPNCKQYLGVYKN